MSPAPRTVRRAGARALLVECADGAEARGLQAALLAAPPSRWSSVDGLRVDEVLPGARTVLVRLAGPLPAAGAGEGLLRLARTLATLPAAPAEAVGGTEVILDTVYDGADLDDVAGALGLTREALVRAHADRRWTAAFVGFAPGFAYLEPDGPAWDVPRRAVPRTVVPAGSVAVAGPYSAAYPRPSPGGWQLLGRTDAVLWDLARDVPALVTAGTRVRFRPVRELVVAGPSSGPWSSPSPAASPVRGLEVVAPGPLSLVEDLGRPGFGHLGVGRSGALDRGAAVRANRLVGNPRGAAVVETLLGGLTLQARGSQVLAVTGAPVALARVGRDGAELAPPAPRAPFPLRDGERLVVGQPATGLRAYVAVRGGLDVDPVLGSRSTDVLARLGPRPLRAGDLLGVLGPPAAAVAGWPDPMPDPLPGGPGEVVTVRLLLGPRDDRLTEDARRRLGTASWRVSPDSDRVGLRLAGEPLERRDTTELPSEGVVAGGVQVPPSGLPVVFLADHPVTGGYPVVAVVHDDDLDRLAQLRPGDGLRFLVEDRDAHGAAPGRRS